MTDRNSNSPQCLNEEQLEAMSGGRFVDAGPRLPYDFKADRRPKYVVMNDKTGEVLGVSFHVEKSRGVSTEVLTPEEYECLYGKSLNHLFR